MKEYRYEAIVIGASAGGMSVTKELVTSLPRDFSMAVIIVQHVLDSSGDEWATFLNRHAEIEVKEADEKEPILPGVVYLAPANYHLLVETDRTFTLTIDEKVNYARPAIDVLFETAAIAYKENVIGIMFTGANYDGAYGLEQVKKEGGVAIAQDPDTAEVDVMPREAIRRAKPPLILPLDRIISYLKEVHAINRDLESVNS